MVFCLATCWAVAEGVNNKVSLSENLPINDCPAVDVIQAINALAPW